ncbi:hypothetical protein ACJX0J_029592 [Zea mays]
MGNQHEIVGGNHVAEGIVMYAIRRIYILQPNFLTIDLKHLMVEWAREALQHGEDSFLVTFPSEEELARMKKGVIRILGDNESAPMQTDGENLNRSIGHIVRHISRMLMLQGLTELTGFNKDEELMDFHYKFIQDRD